MDGWKLVFLLAEISQKKIKNDILVIFQTKAILQKKDGLFGFTPKFSETHKHTLDNRYSWANIRVFWRVRLDDS